MLCFKQRMMNHETVENDLCKHNTESQRCKESLKVLHFSSSCPQFSACESLLIFQDPPQIPLYNLKSFLLAFVFFLFFYSYLYLPLGFPGVANGREPTCQCRRHKRHRFDPWVRKVPWRRAWQPTPVFLPGESHGQRSLVSYSP